jgi:uncharacterized DUF497 family protein
MDFDWDEGNRHKNLKHGVHDREIEEALDDDRSLIIEEVVVDGEERLIVLGRARTSGKYLRVVVTARMSRGSQLVRPISATEMSRRNRRRYQRGR